MYSVKGLILVSGKWGRVDFSCPMRFVERAQPAFFGRSLCFQSLAASFRKMTEVGVPAVLIQRHPPVGRFGSRPIFSTVWGVRLAVLQTWVAFLPDAPARYILGASLTMRFP